MQVFVRNVLALLLLLLLSSRIYRAVLKIEFLHINLNIGGITGLLHEWISVS